MPIFDLLPPGTKILPKTEQITNNWSGKPNKKPRQFRNPDLAGSGEKNHRINKLSHLAPIKPPLCSGIQDSRTTWDAEDKITGVEKPNKKPRKFRNSI